MTAAAAGGMPMGDGASPFKVIGLIGDVCAGKSVAADVFAELGAEVFRADRVVHELLEEQEVKKEVVRAFGEGVLCEDGRVDRAALAECVFSDRNQLDALGRILYPRTHSRIREAVRSAQTAGRPAVVLDAPTLLESGGSAMADEIVYVSAPEARRQAWAAERGWPVEEIGRRERFLLSRSERMGAARRVFSNEGTVEDLKRQVLQYWEED